MPTPTDPTPLAALFRECAAGRREYLRSCEGDERFDDASNLLRLQANTLESVARVIEGDLGPLYDWLPSWRWTQEMTEALFNRQPEVHRDTD